MNIQKNDQLDALFTAILELESVDECYAFFDDLCTLQELKSFGQRFQVAQMLLKNKVYSEIAKETGASTATISRVKRALILGCSGYEKILERIENK